MFRLATVGVLPAAASDPSLEAERTGVGQRLKDLLNSSVRLVASFRKASAARGRHRSSRDLPTCRSCEIVKPVRWETHSPTSPGPRRRARHCDSPSAIAAPSAGSSHLWDQIRDLDLASGGL